jgi:hypothetical protein
MVEQMQDDLDAWMQTYNREAPWACVLASAHSGL